MMQIINRTLYGLVFRCGQCNKIHIEFNNLNFNFTDREFTEFAAYIDGLDGEFWERQNAATVFNRKIRIPVAGTETFCFLLNKYELKRLKELLAVKSCTPIDNLLKSMVMAHHVN